MLADILNRILAPADTRPLPPEDCRLALTALMVRVARADGHFDEDERATISDIISNRYGLSLGDTGALLVEAEALEAQAADTVQFTRLIKECVPYDDRRAVVEQLWEVALADGARSDGENNLLRLVVGLIGIPTTKAPSPVKLFFPKGNKGLGPGPRPGGHPHGPAGRRRLQVGSRW